MQQNIVLIGSVGAGKSTVAALLAQRLSRPRRPMDDLRWDYYREIGYSEKVAKQIEENEGFGGLYRYWKPFEAYVVERLLSEARGSVIDFGAGHSVYEDQALFARVAKALEGQCVIHLLPCPNLDEAVCLLSHWKWDGMVGEENLHEHFVKHSSNHSLAKHTFYTLGKRQSRLAKKSLPPCHCLEGMAFDQCRNMRRPAQVNWFRGA